VMAPPRGALSWERTAPQPRRGHSLAIQPCPPHLAAARVASRKWRVSRPLGSVSQSAPGVRSGRLHGFQREVPRVLIEPCPNALCQRIEFLVTPRCIQGRRPIQGGAAVSSRVGAEGSVANTGTTSRVPRTQVIVSSPCAAHD
jgi:hypothetical protein